MLTGPSGGGGRSVQIASTGLVVDRDQLGAGLGARRAEPFGCRRSVQPRVKTEAVAGDKVLASQCSGGGSTSGSMCQALRSTCFAACSV